jgi:hypothetical protein
MKCHGIGDFGALSSPINPLFIFILVQSRIFTAEAPLPAVRQGGRREDKFFYLAVRRSRCSIPGERPPNKKPFCSELAYCSVSYGHRMYPEHLLPKGESL